MQKKFFLILILTQSFFISLYSQTQSKYELFLKQKFEDFDYNLVVTLTDSILTNQKDLSRNDSLILLYYKAISSFNIWDIKTSEKAFVSILKLDENFTLDTVNVSPKIVSYFNDLKTKFLSEKRNEKQNHTIKIDSLLTIERLKYKSELENYRQAFWRNLILPGWGNIYLTKNTKGYFFAGAFTVSLFSTIYFMFDSNQKEKDYLSEINPDLISEKYSKYNSSYKLRNISIALTSLIYIYSQLDFLLFDKMKFSQNILNNISFSQDSHSKIRANISIPLKF